LPASENKVESYLNIIKWSREWKSCI